MTDFSVDGYPYIIFQWLLFAIATPLVFVRLYVQLRFRYRPWREIFVIAAWLLYMGYTICESLRNDWDWWNMDADWDSMTDAQLAPVLKVTWSEGFMYKTILYACKAALLCFFMDITPRHVFPKTWWCIVVTWLLIVVGTLEQAIQLLAVCRPTYKNWTYSEFGACQTDLSHWSICSWVLHTLTDVMVYIIPILIILHNLSYLSSREKGCAMAMFALGFFNVASAISLVVWYLIPDTTNIPDGYWIAEYFLIPFQAGSAVIIVCVPYCRRLWRGMGSEDLRPGLNAAVAAAAAAIAPADLEMAPVTSVSTKESGSEIRVIIGLDEKPASVA